MSEPKVTWADVLRYFNKNPDYEIKTIGGDKLIVQLPKGNDKRSKKVVRIGHKFSTRKTVEIPPGIISKIQRTFNVNRRQILEG